MVRRCCLWLLLAACVTPLLVWGYDRAYMIMWVGSTDLTVEFAVTDADTDHPIPGARVEIDSQGGFYEERDKQIFALVADEGGVARKECRESMCFGTQSALRFTDTYVVHMPFWYFRVVAEGYEPTEWEYIDDTELVRKVQRTGPRKARLVVPVSLHKRRG